MVTMVLSSLDNGRYSRSLAEQTTIHATLTVPASLFLDVHGVHFLYSSGVVSNCLRPISGSHFGRSLHITSSCGFQVSDTSPSSVPAVMPQISVRPGMVAMTGLPQLGQKWRSIALPLPVPLSSYAFRSSFPFVKRTC